MHIRISGPSVRLSLSLVTGMESPVAGSGAAGAPRLVTRKLTLPSGPGVDTGVVVGEAVRAALRAVPGVARVGVAGSLVAVLVDPSVPTSALLTALAAAGVAATAAAVAPPPAAAAAASATPLAPRALPECLAKAVLRVEGLVAGSVARAEDAAMGVLGTVSATGARCSGSVRLVQVSCAARQRTS